MAHELKAVAFAATMLLVGAAPAAAQDPAGTCRMTLAAQPAACDCIVSRGRSAGLSDATMVRLLRNEATLPAEFDRYRSIHTACVSRATGGAPARGTALPPPPR